MQLFWFSSPVWYVKRFFVPRKILLNNNAFEKYFKRRINAMTITLNPMLASYILFVYIKCVFDDGKWRFSGDKSRRKKGGKWWSRLRANNGSMYMDQWMTPFWTEYDRNAIRSNFAPVLSYRWRTPSSMITGVGRSVE